MDVNKKNAFAAADKAQREIDYLEGLKADLSEANTKFDIAWAIDMFDASAHKTVYAEQRTKAEAQQLKADYLKRISDEIDGYSKLIDYCAGVLTNR